MKYRGQECNERPFTDATGTGKEYYLPSDPGHWVSREHATRVISPAERAATEAAAAKMAEASAKQAAIEAAKVAAQKVADDIEAKTLTFGDAKRDAAMLTLAKAQALTGTVAAVVEEPAKLLVR